MPFTVGRLRMTDFVANADVLRYEVGVDPANGPFEVRAELLYQPIGYRWAMNLRDYDAMETQRFVDFYESLSHASAVVMTSDSWSGDVR